MTDARADGPVSQLDSLDGRYHCVQQGDNNFVVYDASWMPVWDRWSFEASHQQPIPAPVSNGPAPVEAPHPPAAIGVIPQKVTDDRDGTIEPNCFDASRSKCWLDANGDVHVFLGFTTGTPKMFRISPTGDVGSYDWPFPHRGTTEEWYWDQAGNIYLLDGARLLRVNVFTLSAVVVFDIGNMYPGCDLWQPHSSNDGTVHSATVRRIVSDGAYPHIATVVFRTGPKAGVTTDGTFEGRIDSYDAIGELDESQCSRDGEWLLIKEKVVTEEKPDGDELNRVINIRSREETRWLDADGAVGHSDMGPDYVIGEDNIHGACILREFDKPGEPPLVLFKTWGMGHVSLCAGHCLLSDAEQIALVDIQGGGVTHLLNHGMIGDGYAGQVQACLDPTGRVFVYLSNVGTARLDLFLVRI